MTTMNTKDLAERILAQRVNRYLDAGPSLAPWGGARFRIEGGRVRVGYAFARPGAAGQVVERVLRFANDRRLQVQWTVAPERPGEAELMEALAAASFAPIERLLLMARQGCLTTPTNPHVTVLPISTWHDMWRYEHISRQCFYDDPRPSDALVGQRASERWREQEHGWCRYFQAYLDGTLAGGCYVSLYEDVPTIMGVCTLPQARQQGVATALLVRTVASVMVPTNEVVCLFVEVGNPAESLYRALGFMPLLRSDTYQWGQQ